MISPAAYISAAAFLSSFTSAMPAPPISEVQAAELIADELTMEAGVIALPQKPGLGMELNRNALKKYAV